MTQEERKKWICKQCNQNTDCAYVKRNMGYKCILVEERLEGWKLGYKDAIERACKWLRRTQPQVIFPDTTIERFKKAMEEQR